MTTLTIDYREYIAKTVRRLRKEREWTQAELARRLGLSQSRLSEIEHGKGSFTAEQLLSIARLFNITFDDLIPPTRQRPESQIQNALARLGAFHLSESEDSLPTEKLRDIRAILREVLVSPESSRHVAALAPIIVHNIDALNLLEVRDDFLNLRRIGRLGWLLKNIQVAIESELLDSTIPIREANQYRKAKQRIEFALSNFPPFEPATDEVFDSQIVTSETSDLVREQRSSISKEWGLITRLQPNDFQQALRQARDH